MLNLGLPIRAFAKQIGRDSSGAQKFVGLVAKLADGKTGVAVNFAQRPLWLLRGVDRSGRNDFEVGHRRG